MTTQLFYQGRWQEGRAARELREPGTHERIDDIGLADEGQARKAVQALVEAEAATRRLPAHRRSAILHRLAELIERDRRILAETIRREAGKPIRLARGEVDRALITTRWAAAECLRLHGATWRLDISPATEGLWGFHLRVPRGPVLAVTPFNFPLNLVLHKLAPALAVGAPVMIKPAPQTPLTALHLTRLVLEAGWPEHALAYLPCPNEIAAGLVESPGFGVVSFTGSAAVGWRLKAAAGKKKVVLELGGNAGVIIHHDADIGAAASRCAFGAYVYAGQVCISVQRIYVHRNVFPEFVEAFRDAAAGMKVGPTEDEATLIGPMIQTSAADRVESWIHEARTRGAEPVREGTREGDWVHPWAFTRVPSDQPLACEEVFGPVAVLEPYEDFREALAKVNDSRYGLQAGVFTQRWDLIQEAIEELEVGGLIVNDIPTLRVDPMPYGGMKDSGFGREGIRFAMEEMTDIRMVVFRRRRN